MKNDTPLSILEDGSQDAPSAKPKQSRTSKPKASPKERPTKSLPSTRLAFDNQLDILRGYAAASGPGNNPVSISEVADIVKTAESSFSLVNPFFCEIGLLQRIEQAGQSWKYLPCEDVCNFSKAYEWNRETAAQKLAPVIRSSWFADALLRKLSFEPLNENEAIATLAEKASAGPDYKSNLRLLLNYMESAGLIQRENGMVKMIKASSGTPVKEATSSAPEQKDPKEQAAFKSSSVSTAFVQPTQGIVNFHVDVKINMDEFANWSPDRITSFFAGIAQVLAAKSAVEKDAGKEQHN